MTLNPFPGKYKIPVLAVLCALALLGYIYRIPIWEKITGVYHLFTDREQIRTFVTSFGMGGGVVFILIQILQVLFAPFPGEASGFIGGYLFGTTKGFVYSSIGLAIGSCINFSIGRFLGIRFVRKLIPSDQFARIDTILRRQGILVIFILFVFPGFPKDYLCFFLGISTVPFKAFIILASIGRMPGTFMLSLQGAAIFEQMYGLFAIVICGCLIFAFFAYLYREDLYHWIDKLNDK